LTPDDSEFEGEGVAIFSSDAAVETSGVFGGIFHGTRDHVYAVGGGDKQSLWEFDFIGSETQR